MTTAFALTFYDSPINYGPGLAYLNATCQVSSSVPTGGEACDLSSYFSTVFCMHSSCGAVKADISCNPLYVHTADATNGGVIATSAGKLAIYWDKNSSAGAFLEAASGDASAVATMKLMFIGRAI